MQDFENIESIWAKHSVDVKLSADEIIKQAKKEVNSMRNRSIFNIIAMISSLLIILLLWLYVDFKSITTHLGISIMILTIFGYTIILYRNHKMIATAEFTAHPSQFLNRLKQYQTQRYLMHGKLYWIYLTALTLGIGLYFYEVLAVLSEFWKIVTYIITLAWLIFCSTYIRKNVIKRDKERISTLINTFERLSNQFD